MPSSNKKNRSIGGVAVVEPTLEPTRKNFTPPGKRKQNLDRRFDQTQLKSTTHGYTVHRDYAAHFFRWGFAFQRIEYQRTRVLDLGCGQEIPLARVLSFRLSAVPALYVGVDLNKIAKPFKAKWARVHDGFSFVDRHQELMVEYGTHSFQLLTCFEVFEHMHPADGLTLLRNAWDLCSPDGRLILSTPVYNGRRMAANHIKEYTVDEMERVIVDSGVWEVEERFGTFASWNDVKKVITPAEQALYQELNRYYDHEVLSCFLAPKYPDASRNNVWVLRPKIDWSEGFGTLFQNGEE